MQRHSGFCTTFEDSDFVLKADILKNYINKKTKALILNNPNNPCGCVYTKQDLEEIAKLAIKNNIFVISDEIYDRLIYDNTKHISIASFMDMPERTLLVNGVSKSFAMTGWRIGFAAGPSQLIEVMESLQSHSTSNPNSIAQKASIEALTYYAKDEILSTMVAEFSKRRKYMVNKINSMNNMSCRLPKGAFYVFVNISKTFGKKCDGKTINNSIEFAELLLEKYKVAVVPGIAFGDNNYVRLSYATSMANIKKGLERIEEFDKILK